MFSENTLNTKQPRIQDVNELKNTFETNVNLYLSSGAGVKNPTGRLAELIQAILRIYDTNKLNLHSIYLKENDLESSFKTVFGEDVEGFAAVIEKGSYPLDTEKVAGILSNLKKSELSTAELDNLTQSLSDLNSGSTKTGPEFQRKLSDLQKQIEEQETILKRKKERVEAEVLTTLGKLRNGSSYVRYPSELGFFFGITKFTPEEEDIIQKYLFKLNRYIWFRTEGLKQTKFKLGGREISLERFIKGLRDLVKEDEIPSKSNRKSNRKTKEKVPSEDPQTYHTEDMEFDVFEEHIRLVLEQTERYLKNLISESLKNTEKTTEFGTVSVGKGEKVHMNYKNTFEEIKYLPKYGLDFSVNTEVDLQSKSLDIMIEADGLSQDEETFGVQQLKLGKFYARTFEAVKNLVEGALKKSTPILSKSRSGNNLVISITLGIDKNKWEKEISLKGSKENYSEDSFEDFKLSTGRSTGFDIGSIAKITGLDGKELS